VILLAERPDGTPLLLCSDMWSHELVGRLTCAAYDFMHRAQHE
jgi:hypothetical protein